MKFFTPPPQSDLRRKGNANGCHEITCASRSAIVFSRFISTSATTIINGKAGVSIHPNPAKGILNVHGTIGMSFMITDITGRTMISGKLHSANEVIDISSLTPGQYIINTSGDNAQAHSIKFIKQ